MVTMAAGGILGEDFIALHMTWGAINEWTTQAGYARLSRLAGHPVLSELLGRIMRQEGRHIDFYASQAERRLSERPRAQRITRFALARLWHPVGSGVMPPEETRFLARHLFGGDQGLATAQRIDRRIARLPGLFGLHLLEDEVGRSRVENAGTRRHRRRTSADSSPGGASTPGTSSNMRGLPRSSSFIHVPVQVRTADAART
jgi:hypothetical protein